MYLIFQGNKYLGNIAKTCLDTDNEVNYSVEFTDTVYENLLGDAVATKLHGYTYMNVSIPLGYMKFLPQIAEKVSYKLTPRFHYKV